MAPDPPAARAFVTHGPAATEALAEALARHLPRGAVLALEGDLGAGKTAFVRGLARGLDIDEPVTSPTFTLMHRYEGERRTLDHFDAWMEGRERAFLADGGAEVLGADDVAAVEWAGRVADWLPTPRLDVRIEHRGPGTRRLALSVRGEGPAADALHAALAALHPPPDVLEPAPGPG